MAEQDIIDLMMHHGVRPTANRIMIANTFVKAGRPLSMMEIESELESVDKSVISRALTLFREQHLVHVLPDGGDGIRYELCRSCNDSHDEDAHIHFYCKKCGKTFCLEDISIPEVAIPSGYKAESVNYMVTGICPDCSKS